MSFFSPSEKDPKSDLMIINPRNYNHSKLDRSNRKYIANKIRDKHRSFENEDVFQVSDINGNFEVLKISPSPSIPVNNTEIKFRNRIVYQEGFDEFDISDERLIEISDKPDLDELKQVVNPEDFANLVDSSSALIEYYSDENIYILSDYYHIFN